MWFEVDKAGLGKILQKRGKFFALTELIQNAWDAVEGTSGADFDRTVHINLQTIPNKPEVKLVVRDFCPDGFKSLHHAWTLFAESDKKDSPILRGRFNLGEKLVLAICNRAIIETTTGTVEFNESGRHVSKGGLQTGSQITCYMRITREEFAEIEEKIYTLIPPQDVPTLYNGIHLHTPKPVQSIQTKLPVEIAISADGAMGLRSRETTVHIYESGASDGGWIYELGIPVVQTGDRFHYNVMQKVPMNMDRDNVSPKYLQQLRVAVFNATHKLLEAEDVNQSWVQSASSDPRAEADSMKTFIEKRHGEKSVMYDPSDPEANMAAVAEGYNLIYGRHLNAKQHENVRRFGLVSPAGQVTPRKLQFGGTADSIPFEGWTPGMKAVAQYAQDLARKTFDVSISVVMLDAGGLGATYGSRTLTFYVKSLGKKWFSPKTNSELIDRLIIHELGHEKGHHLEAAYHAALCKIGATLKKWALTEPQYFRKLNEVE